MMYPRFRLRWRRVGTWFLAVTTASALVVASTVAEAADGDGDSVDEGIEDQAERAVDFRGVPPIDPEKLWIVSQSVDAPIRDWFRVSFEAGEFTIVYTQEYPFVAASFDLEFSRLIEWNDTNGDGRFQPASNEWLSDVPLGSTAFGQAVATHSMTQSEAAGVMHSVRVVSADNEIELELMITGRFFRLPEGRVLTPMEMKLNVTLNHNLLNPRAGVALQLQMDTDEAAVFEPSSWDAIHGFSQDESWINVTGGSAARSATVFFSWSNNATVDGVTQRVDAWGPDTGSSGSYDVFLVYPAGADSDPARIVVRHDPTLGVVSAAFSSVLTPPVFRPFAGDPVLYGASVAAIAAIVAGTMVLAKRRRRA